MSLHSGGRLGDYEIVELLGRGAMGQVYRARELTTGRHVALKVIRPEGVTAVREQRFEREAQLTATLSHPGIVRVHSAGVIEGVRYIAYELVEGARALDEAWRGQPLRDRVALVRDAARAVGAAHAQGVVHRDLKPENVLVNGAGGVKVADFGLAGAVGLEKLTVSGQIVGTPTHMAPEQVKGTSPTTATDVWGLGVILYHALTDELPFTANSLTQQITAILSVDPPPPRSLRPEVPLALERVCLRALRRAPQDRYADAEALAAALDRALVGESEQAIGRRVGLWLVPVAAVLLLMTVGLFALLPPPDEPTRAAAGGTGPPVTPPPPATPTPTPTPTPPRAIPRKSWEERLREALPVPDPREPNQVTKARMRILEGDLISLTRLGEAYQRGEVLPLREAMGQELLELAVEKGEPHAMLVLSDTLADEDPARALALLEDSARLGYPKAIVFLAGRYHYGVGLPRDPARALKLYLQLEPTSNKEALYGLGRFYARGFPEEGFPRDPQRALEFLKRAVYQGNRDAPYGLTNLIRAERAGGRELPGAEAWLRERVGEARPETGAALGKLIMGDEHVLRAGRGRTKLRLWGAGSPARPLDERLDLRINGSRHVVMRQGEVTERRFTCNGRPEHLWIVWDAAGKVANRYDVLERVPELRVIESKGITEASYTQRVETPNDGTWIFVAESPRGELSNLAFVQVVTQ